MLELIAITIVSSMALVALTNRLVSIIFLPIAFIVYTILILLIF